MKSYSIEQLQLALKNAKAANDLEAIKVITEIMQKRNRSYTAGQLQLALKNARAVGDLEAIKVITKIMPGPQLPQQVPPEYKKIPKFKGTMFPGEQLMSYPWEAPQPQPQPQQQAPPEYQETPNAVYRGYGSIVPNHLGVNDQATIAVSATPDNTRVQPGGTTKTSNFPRHEITQGDFSPEAPGFWDELKRSWNQFKEVQAPAMVGGTLSMAGTTKAYEPRKTPYTKLHGYVDYRQRFTPEEALKRTLNNPLYQKGEEIRAYAHQVAEEHPELQPPAGSEEFGIGTMLHPGVLGRTIGGVLPSMLISMGAGTTTALATKSPTLGIAVGSAIAFAMEGGSAYDDARKYGLTPEEAQRVGMVVGGINSMIEVLPVGVFIKNSGIGKLWGKEMTKRLIEKKLHKEIGKAVLEQTAANVVEEMTQELNNIYHELGYLSEEDKPDTEAILRRLGEAGWGGALGGIGGGVVAGSVSRMSDVGTGGGGPLGGDGGGPLGGDVGIGGGDGGAPLGGGGLVSRMFGGVKSTLIKLGYPLDMIEELNRDDLKTLSKSGISFDEYLNGSIPDGVEDFRSRYIGANQEQMAVIKETGDLALQQAKQREEQREEQRKKAERRQENERIRAERAAAKQSAETVPETGVQQPTEELAPQAAQPSKPLRNPTEQRAIMKSRFMNYPDEMVIGLSGEQRDYLIDSMITWEEYQGLRPQGFPSLDAVQKQVNNSREEKVVLPKIEGSTEPKMVLPKIDSSTGLEVVVPKMEVAAEQNKAEEQKPIPKKEPAGPITTVTKNSVKFEVWRVGDRLELRSKKKSPSGEPLQVLPYSEEQLQAHHNRVVGGRRAAKATREFSTSIPVKALEDMPALKAVWGANVGEDYSGTFDGILIGGGKVWDESGDNKGARYDELIPEAYGEITGYEHDLSAADIIELAQREVDAYLQRGGMSLEQKAEEELRRYEEYLEAKGEMESEAEAIDAEKEEAALQEMDEFLKEMVEAEKREKESKDDIKKPEKTERNAEPAVAGTEVKGAKRISSMAETDEQIKTTEAEIAKTQRDFEKLQEQKQAEVQKGLFGTTEADQTKLFKGSELDKAITKKQKELNGLRGKLKSLEDRREALEKQEADKGQLKFSDDTVGAAGPESEQYLRGLEKNPQKIAAIRAPELLQLVRRLGGYAFIKRNMPEHLRGWFSGTEESFKIALNPKIAASEAQWLHTFAHEIGHMLDFLPEKTMSRGNLLGRLMVLIENRNQIIAKEGVSDNEIRVALKKRSQLIAKIRRIEARKKAGATEYSKVPIDKALDNAYSALEKIDALFHIEKAVEDELWELSKLWRPFEKEAEANKQFMAYRKSAPELYADFISTLLNAPDLAYNLAPKAWQLWHDNINKKQEFLDIYRDLMYLSMNEKKLMEERFGVEAMKRISSDGAALDRAKDMRRSPDELVPLVLTGLVDRYKMIIAKDRELVKAGLLREEDSIEGFMQLSHRRRSNIIARKFEPLKEVINFAKEHGVSDADIGDYIKFTRIVTQRKAIASEGYTQTEASKNLEEMKRRLGDDGYKALQDTVEKIQNWWNKTIMAYAAETGFISAEAYDNLANNLAYNDYYLTESEVKKMEANLKRGESGIVIEKSKLSESEAEDYGLEYDPDKYYVVTQEKNVYAPFVPRHWFVKNGISPNIHNQIGTLSDLMDPYYALLFKAKVMVRASFNNGVKRDFGEHALKYWDGVKEHNKNEADTGPLTGTLYYRLDGKRKGVVMNKAVVESFDYAPNEVVRAIMKLPLKKFHQAFKAVVLVYNPGFAVFNIIRDHGATTMAYHVKRSGFWKWVPGSKVQARIKLAYYYAKNLKLAHMAATGKVDPRLSEMWDNDVLFQNFSSVFLHGDGLDALAASNKPIGTYQETAKELKRLQSDKSAKTGEIINAQNKVVGAVEYILDDTGVIDLEKPYRHKVSDILFGHNPGKLLIQLLSSLKYINDVGEKLGKISAYDIMLPEVGKVFPDRKALGEFTGIYASTPDFNIGGKWKPANNMLFLFWDIFKEGIRRGPLGLGRQKGTRGIYWWTMFRGPALLAFAITGLMRGWFSDDEDEDKNNNKYKLWYQKAFTLISDYNRESYICIPFGMMDINGDFYSVRESQDVDKMFKSVYLSIPMDEMERIVFGTVTRVLKATAGDDTRWNDYLRVFDYAADQIPSATPAMKVLWGWGAFINNGNTIDSYRNTPVVPAKYEKDTKKSLEYMVRWTLKSTGLSGVVNAYDLLSKNKDMRKLERIIAAIPIVNRFVKFSDRGASDFYRASISGTERNKQLMKLRAEDFVKAWVKNYVKNSGEGDILQVIDVFTRQYGALVEDALAENALPKELKDGRDLQQSIRWLANEYWQITGKQRYGSVFDNLASAKDAESKEIAIQQAMPIAVVKNFRQAGIKLHETAGRLSMELVDFQVLLQIAREGTTQEPGAGYISNILADKYQQYSRVLVP